MAKRDYGRELFQLGVSCDDEVVRLGPDVRKQARRFAYQQRAEVLLFCEWIEKKEIRSYLEIGFYRGGLVSALHALFAFDKVYGCDAGLIQAERGLSVELPDDARICWAEAESPRYKRYRHSLGKIDLVFIDADHSYGSVRADYERERKQAHRFLAFHDIKNTRQAPGVVRLWNEIGGKKRELYVPRTDGGDEMGIGIWSEKETP
ncbi:MAG TPA: class I SAM-dependent methyltransferase [Candidatus Krumholzibacteria bacterium]